MTSTERRARYTHTVKRTCGDCCWAHFPDEHSALQSHEKMVGHNRVIWSEVRFSDFGGADCSPRVIAHWAA